MRTLAFLLLCLAGSAAAQTIEGYWQDTERRILFSPDAPPGVASIRSIGASDYPIPCGYLPRASINRDNDDAAMKRSY